MLGFALTIFFSAFLLFQVQPMIGKFVLPWFGGSPLAWATCMLFFQVLLLAGYGYAHLLVKTLSPRKQARVHVVLLVISFVFLPIIPSDTWRPEGSESAIARILLLLTATIGAPFLLLSSTGPLMQAWFTRSHPGRSPYRLYALSNVASLLALISYPFLIEPALTLRVQTYIWSGGYVLFAIACGWCAFRFQAVPESNAESAEQPVDGEISRPGILDKVLWIVLPAAGSVMLLATTNKITQDVAVVPFLWIVPLCVYLLTFILCFDSAKWYWRPFWGGIALPLALAGAYYAPSLTIRTPVVLQLGAYIGTLFVLCMICHGELVRLKPSSKHLTLFYFFTSAGGALGGIFVNLIAPLIFVGFWEYRLGACLCVLLFFVALYHDPKSKFFSGLAWIVILPAFVFMLNYFVVQMQYEISDAVVTIRSFYGVLRVDAAGLNTAKLATYQLIHGRIEHGIQYLDEDFRKLPISYYGPKSGVGLAELEMHRRQNADGKFKTVRTGVVGLGAGVMASYGFEGDSVRFYEIDANVVKLSKEYFNYTTDSAAKVDVVLGDARISLEREQARGESQRFDVLVLDAFSGDGIPLHLLTTQAFDLYQYHLKADGILAVHISNKYLDLRPLVRGLAEHSGKQAVQIEDDVETGGMYNSSSWVLITSNREFLESPPLVLKATPWDDDVPHNLIFTDDYSNLFKLLKRRR